MRILRQALAVSVLLSWHASARAQPRDLPFRALGPEAAWRFEASVDMLDGEDPTRAPVELHVTEEQTQAQGRVVRWEWRGEAAEWLGLLPRAAVIDQRGMRLEERGSPLLPRSFAQIRGRAAINRTYVSARQGLGCFEHEHRGRGEGEFYSWRLCFDESGAPREAAANGTGSELQLASPVAVSPARREAIATAASPGDSEPAFATWLLEAGGAILGAATGTAPAVRWNGGRGLETDDLRATAQRRPLPAGAELLAVTARVEAITADPGYIDATVVVLADGRVRWTGFGAGSGATEFPGDARLATAAPALAAIVDRLATVARGACDLAPLTAQDVPWATPGLLQELASSSAQVSTLCNRARPLTGRALPHVLYLQVLASSGGRLHALRSQVERPAEGPPRIWLRAAEVDAL